MLSIWQFPTGVGDVLKFRKKVPEGIRSGLHVGQQPTLNCCRPKPLYGGHIQKLARIYIYYQLVESQEIGSKNWLLHISQQKGSLELAAMKAERQFPLSPAFNHCATSSSQMRATRFAGRGVRQH
jgi:hypothetical protein